MASNLVERVHTPAFMQGIALNFRTPQFIADKISPRTRVTKQSDKYRRFGKDGLYAVENTWAPGAIPNAITTELSDDTYYALIRKLRHQLLDSELNNQDDDLDLRTMYTERTTLAMRVSREARVAALFTTAANYPGANVTTKAGGSEWDAAGVINTTTPIDDLEATIEVVAASSLVSRADLSVVIPENVLSKTLRHNSAVRDYYKYTAGGVLTADILQSLLGVKEVLTPATQYVGSGPKNAANDIITGITTTYLWGDNVWVGVVAPENGGNDEYSFSRSFNWTAETGGQELQIRQYRMADEGQEGDWIEGKEAIDEKIVASFAGGLIKNVLS